MRAAIRMSLAHAGADLGIALRRALAGGLARQVAQIRAMETATDGTPDAGTHEALTQTEAQWPNDAAGQGLRGANGLHGRGGQAR